MSAVNYHCMLDRNALLAELSSKTFDVFIVGGGITGAGIARDAAMRGLSVALVDKGDFASGTSSRSSRLIHGGVRYLEHGYLRLVFEASAERRRLLRIAPHLVRPLAFTWPVYRGQRLPLWKLRVGLTLYDLLALFRNVGRHASLTPGEILDAEPRLRKDRLVGGVRYFDAATDDTRLTLANVLDARQRGAVVANHVAFVGVVEHSDGTRVARIEDALSGDRAEVRALVFVNAAGPWSDAVERLETGASGGRIQGSKGAHISVSRSRIGNDAAVTMLHPRDGRVMFTLPSGAHTIIGTTDSFTATSPDEVRANEADVAYLLEGANSFFPDARLEPADIVAAWAGIRPLMRTKGSSVSASREHSIQRDARRVTVTGGKLTTYRVMARQVVDVVQDILRRPRHRAATGDELLPQVGGAPASGSGDVEPGLPYRMDMLKHAVDQELASTLGDLLVRRTHLAFETRDHGRAAARKVAAVLGWGTKEVERYDVEVARLFTIDP
jgi:glycerol-3-phosphate dehydrogenase